MGNKLSDVDYKILILNRQIDILKGMGRDVTDLEDEREILLEQRNDTPNEPEQQPKSGGRQGTGSGLPGGQIPRTVPSMPSSGTGIRGLPGGRVPPMAPTMPSTGKGIPGRSIPRTGPSAPTRGGTTGPRPGGRSDTDDGDNPNTANDETPTDQPPENNAPPQSTAGNDTTRQSSPETPEPGGDTGKSTDGEASAERTGVASLVSEIKRPPDDPAHAVMLKAPFTWTEGERDLAMSTVHDLPDSDPRRKNIQDGVTRWYKHYYPGNVEWDATGRMIHPAPAFPIPQEPTRVVIPDGRPLEHALERLGRHIEATSGDATVPHVVMGLQSGLNIVDMESEERSEPMLVEDGEFGPRTKGALHRTLVRLGPGRVEEALALGRFNAFARGSADSGDPGELKVTARTIFGPLFPQARAGDAHSMVAQALQDTVNDLAAERADGDDHRIAVDGDIGPETFGAFKRTVATVGPEHLTRRFARNLGFLR